MTKRNRDLAQRGTGAVTAGSGQASGPAGPVAPARFGTVLRRVVPAQLACRIGARARAGERDAWPAVAAIAVGTFALVFSELIPVGMLTDISGGLHVSVGTGGLMVVVPAVAAAVAAPLLTLCSARLERRAVLVALSALVLVSDVIAGLAPGIGVMLAARALLGVCVGGFWVFGAGAAITLVSERARGTAVAVVSSGIFLATVASLPAGSLIGTLTTWRAAFAVAAVFAVIAVAALLFSLGGYAEYAVASIWTRKPDTVSWIDAAALPSSAEAAAGVLRQLNVTSGETLLLVGGGGSVGVIATQLAVARGVTVISAVGEHDETLARELGATPVRYGPGVAGRVRALGPVDAVFDAAGQGVLADAVALAGGPKRVITLSDPAAADFGVTLSEPTPDRAPGALDQAIALLADGRLRLRAHQTMPMQEAADAHRQLESGTVHQRIILTLN